MIVREAKSIVDARRFIIITPVAALSIRRAAVGHARGVRSAFWPPPRWVASSVAAVDDRRSRASSRASFDSWKVRRSAACMPEQSAPRGAPHTDVMRKRARRFFARLRSANREGMRRSGVFRAPENVAGSAARTQARVPLLREPMITARGLPAAVTLTPRLSPAARYLRRLATDRARNDAAPELTAWCLRCGALRDANVSGRRAGSTKSWFVAIVCDGLPRRSHDGSEQLRRLRQRMPAGHFSKMRARCALRRLVAMSASI